MDADDTLFDFGKCESDALRAVLRGEGLPDGDEIIAEYSRINLGFWKMLERREITKDRLKYARFEEFVKYFDFYADPAVLADGYAEGLAFQHSLLPGAEETCRILSKDRRIYVITNGIGTVQQRRIAESGLSGYFSGVFVSELLGAEKPSPVFFEQAAKQIPGFDPAAALVVGDSISSDIRGGIGFGLDVCWVNMKNETPPDGLAINYTVRSVSELPALLESLGR